MAESAGGAASVREGKGQSTVARDIPLQSWPLSPSQEGMFFQSLAYPGAGCYIEQVSCRLREALDVPGLTRCWQSAARRHSILRCAFQRDGVPEPRQFVEPEVVVPVALEDWRGEAAQAARLNAYREEDRRRGFDMREAPLMRVAIFRLDEAEYEMLWTVHHLLADGRAMNQLLREVFEEYAACQRGAPAAHQATGDFGAYAAWLRNQSMSGAQDFWRRRLDGRRAPTELPLMLPARGGADTPGHGHARRRLAPGQTAALAAFACEHDLTLNIVLLGAWALLVHRYTDAPDIVLGATKSVRHGSAAPPATIGPYINTLPVRTGLDGETRLVPWLQQLREQWFGLREYEHTPVDVIRACCDLPGDAPLYTIYYVFERETLGDSLRSIGGAWASRELELYEHTPVPIILAGYGGESLLLSLEYDARLLDAAAADRLLAHLENLLAAMTVTPDVPASRLPLFTAEEMAERLRACQPEPVPAAKALTHRQFEAAAARFPDSDAVVYRDRPLTYAALNRSANQLARHLLALGVHAETRVAVCLPASPEAMVALLAVFKAGGAYVPMDPAYPADRLAFMLEDSGAALVITEPEYRSRLQRCGAPLLVPAEEGQTLDAYSGGDVEVEVSPADLAYIIYTSGSTGVPKGVCIAHGEAARHFETMCEVYRIVPEDHVLQFASLSFDVSLEQIFVTLVAGAALYIADTTVYSGPRFSRFVRESRLTVVNLPPAFWQQWTDEGIAGEDGAFGPQVRLVTVGGDIMLPRTVSQWQQHDCTRSVGLMNAYGPTETVITALYYDVPPGFGAETARDWVPIGRPIRGTEAIILDRFQNLVPPGLPGELYLGGNRLARGYHNRPDLTARAFVTHPWRAETGARLYRTGDRVRQLPDGNIEFLGRFDDQVKLRGFRIELREIEVALLHCEGIREAVVRCRTHRSGETYLAAWVVPEHGHTVDPAALRGSLRSMLPAYMVPDGFMPMASLPVTVNGKVNHDALPDLDEQALRPAGGRVAPRTATEEALAAIWRDVLQCATIGVEDSFFDLGGHSLRAARVVTRIQTELGVQVALGDFLQAPTIAALAAMVENKSRPKSNGVIQPSGTGDPCVVVLQQGDGPAPLFCVLGAGGAVSAYGALVRHLEIGRPVYGLQYSHLPDAARFRTVEQVAERYLIALRSVQPCGPYYLAGWSFGGLVAYEMACRLREEGASIALLAIIDCEARVPAAWSIRCVWDAARDGFRHAGRRVHILNQTRDILWIHARDLARLMGRALLGRRNGGISIREYLDYVRSNVLNLYALRQGGVDTADLASSRLDMVNDQFVRNVVAGLRANARAGAAYQMRPYGATVTLFRTCEVRQSSHGEDDTLGYGAIAGNVDVVMLEGNHFTLVREPSVGLLAARLTERLDAARMASGGPAG